MNIKFQKINIEDVIFFDTECVRSNYELELNSIEYNLYQKKTRNRETDEYLLEEDLQKDYIERGALKRVYNKIVTIGIGYVKNNIPYIKDITGDEEYIIEEFVKIVNNFKYCCSFNGIAFDLPLIVGNGMKYFNIAEQLNDSFNPSGKKPWNLDMCIDLMDQFKGTHYTPNSLDEVCYHFEIPTPKDDINGSDVSRVYYEEGIERISNYVKKDVLANINIFRRMQFKDIYEDYIDRTNVCKDNVKKVSMNPMEQLYKLDYFSDEIKENITKRLEKKKLTKKDREFLQELLETAYTRTEFMASDSKDVVEAKKAEIQEYLKTLK